MAGSSVSELMEYPVPVILLHSRMDVKAGVAELCDLLSQKLYTVHRVTEDD